MEAETVIPILENNPVEIVEDCSGDPLDINYTDSSIDNYIILNI
jgi:hypothetical protein